MKAGNTNNVNTNKIIKTIILLGMFLFSSSIEVSVVFNISSPHSNINLIIKFFSYAKVLLYKYS